MWQAVCTISISYPCKLCDNRSDSACMIYVSAEYIKMHYLRRISWSKHILTSITTLSQLFYCLLFCCSEPSLLCASVHNAVTNPDRRCSFVAICIARQPLSCQFFLLISSLLFLISYFIGRAWVAVHVCDVRFDNCADSIFPYECRLLAASCCCGSWNPNRKCHDMVSNWECQNECETAISLFMTFLSPFFCSPFILSSFIFSPALALFSFVCFCLSDIYTVVVITSWCLYPLISTYMMMINLFISVYWYLSDIILNFDPLFISSS